MSTGRTQFKVIMVFTLLWCWTWPVHSSPPEPLPQGLLMSQFHLLALTTDFERYRNGQGQADVYEQLQSHLRQFRQHFTALQAPSSGLSDAEREGLKQRWTTVARPLGAQLVTLRQGGFIDQEIQYQYHESTTLLWQALYEITLTHHTPSARWRLIQQLQQANLRYLQPHWVLAPHTQQDLPQLVQTIRQHMAEASLVDDEFQKKWPLLEQALLQEERNLSFIVNRYTSELVLRLQSTPHTTE